MTSDTLKKLQCMKAGENYTINDELLHMQQECADKLLEINRLPVASPEREKILNSLFAQYGKNNIIKSGLQCNYGFNITIGDNCYFNYNLVILDSFKVSIGNNVFIAPNVVIAPVTHPLQADKRRQLIGGEVIIEDDVWIGANSVILPNTIIKRGSVIGAGSVVKQNTIENAVYAGCPAKLIKLL